MAKTPTAREGGTKVCCCYESARQAESTEGGWAVPVVQGEFVINPPKEIRLLADNRPVLNFLSLFHQHSFSFAVSTSCSVYPPSSSSLVHRFSRFPLLCCLGHFLTQDDTAACLALSNTGEQLMREAHCCNGHRFNSLIPPTCRHTAT